MNHLVNEQSPYLIQHAHQPVDWYPWGQLAFNKAKDEDKPILLSIGYATCHWCHVMAHESFDDEQIAKVLNDHFVCIKLDREERPDIDHIYMKAVMAMTGSGGWPLNVFLFPNGKPFYGGTYFPPVARWGSMGFKELLLSIQQAWSLNRLSLSSSSEELVVALSKPQVNTATSGLPSIDDAQRAFEYFARDFDETNGGFGKSPKFPMGHVLWFLARYYHVKGQEQAKTIVEHTLTAMACGGICDHLGGGFHRYSVDEQWHVPHFEKMLYDQAVLLRAYCEGYQLTGNLLFAQTARAIADYVLGEMTHPQGGFYTAQDADSEDSEGKLVEGAYYVFTAKEIEQVLGPDDALIFNQSYGVEEHGNVSHDPHGEFVNKNVLYRAALNVDDEAALQSMRQKLLAWRGQRKPPLLDDKILTDLNGLMIGALAFAGRVLHDNQYIHAAKRAADFIQSHMYQDGQWWHRWRNDNIAHMATLDDFAYLAHGLVDLYESTFDDTYLSQAQDLCERMCQQFEDPQGGFYMTSSAQSDVIFRPKDAGDGAIPTGNSMAAIVLVRLRALTGEEQYQQVYERLINAYAGDLMTQPSVYTGIWCAWLHDYHGGMEVLFHGDTQDSEIAKMHKILYKAFRPFVVARASSAQSQPCVYVCRKRVCHMPVTTLNAFEELING